MMNECSHTILNPLPQNEQKCLKYDTLSCGMKDDLDMDDDENKMKRCPEKWKQNVRKKNKNMGLEYVGANGKLKEGKKLGPPCTCKEKCYLKIGTESCSKIFTRFWKLGDHALQNAYIAGCVRIHLPRRCYKKEGPSRRFYSREFHVNVNGVDISVCKQAFLNLHSISNGRLDRLLKKKQEDGITGTDGRGKHNNKVNKIPADKIRMVREHINEIRKRAGYVGRRKSKKIEILPYHYTIRYMYRLYKEEVTSHGLEPVCEYRYRKVFHNDFHLDFAKTPPASVKQDNNNTQQCENNLVEGDCDLGKQHCGEEEQEEHENNILTHSSCDLINDPSLTRLDKQIMYTHSETNTDKDLQLKVEDAAYVALTQQLFNTDYNSFQHNWVFNS